MSKSEQDAFLAQNAKVCPVFHARLTSQGCRDYKNADNPPPQCAACPGIEQVEQQPASGLESGATPVGVSALTGWDLVRQVTGVQSHRKLADIIRGAQCNVSLIFRKVEAGTMPRGKVWLSILSYSNLTAEQVMGRPLTPEERGPAPGGWPKGQRSKAASTTTAPDAAAADLDVATSHAEPGRVSEADLSAAREPADIPPPVYQAATMADVSIENMLHELRRRLPGMQVNISVAW